MTPNQRRKAFDAARQRVLRERTATMVATRDELVRLLTTAKERIAAILAKQPSDYQRWSVLEIQREIDIHLAALRTGASAVIDAAADKAWRLGQDVVDRPLAAAGVQMAAALPRLDVAQLLAIRTFMVDRIADITREAARKIGTELGLVTVGTQGLHEAVNAVEHILGVGSRARAQTIVRTELGRVFASAGQERMTQAGKALPGLKKQWRRSGKVHSRAAHDAADGQVKPVNEPFMVGGAALMYPQDPAGAPEDTINCGCVSLPYMDDWTVQDPGRRPFSDEELAANPFKRALAAS